MMKIKKKRLYIVLSLFFLLMPLFSSQAMASVSPEMLGMMQDLRNNVGGFDLILGQPRPRPTPCDQAAFLVASGIINQVAFWEMAKQVVFDPLLSGLSIATAGTPLGTALDAVDLIQAARSGSVAEFAATLGSQQLGNWIGERAGDITGELAEGKIKGLYDWATAQSALEDEVYDSDGYSCEGRIHAVWSKRNGTITLTLSGNCRCRRPDVSIRNLIGDVRLAAWSVTIEGRTRLIRVQGGWQWGAQFVRLRITSACCYGSSATARTGNEYIYGTPITPPPQRPTTGSSRPPERTPTPPAPPTPPPVDPERERIERLQDHASRMEAALRDCQAIEAEIARVRQSLQDNAQRQSDLRNQIARVEQELAEMERRARVNVYEDNRTGRVFTAGYATGPNMVHKGWIIPSERARQINQKRQDLENLRNQLAQLEREAADLQNRLNELLEALEQCRQRGDAIRQECLETSSYFTQKFAVGWSHADAWNALERYNQAARIIDGLLQAVTSGREEAQKARADQEKTRATIESASKAVESTKGGVVLDPKTPSSRYGAFVKDEAFRQFAKGHKDDMYVNFGETARVTVTGGVDPHFVFSGSPATPPPPVGVITSDDLIRIDKIIHPRSAPGSTIFIRGRNFPDKNRIKVFFGDQEGKILTGNSESLAVVVPQVSEECQVYLLVDGRKSNLVTFTPGKGEEATPGTGSEEPGIAVKLTVGKPKIKEGETTWGKFTVTGTTRPVKIHFVNRDPGVASVDGGNEQTLKSSGGEENLLTITIRGTKGHAYYTIEYGIVP